MKVHSRRSLTIGNRPKFIGSLAWFFDTRGKGDRGKTAYKFALYLLHWIFRRKTCPLERKQEWVQVDWSVTLHKHTNQRMSIVYAWNMQHVTSRTTWFIQRAFLLTHSILYTLNRFFVLPWNNMGWWQSISGNNMRRVYSFILNDSLSPAIRSQLQRFRARYHKSRLLPKTRPSWSLQWERANQGQVVWSSFPVVSTGFRVCAQ